MAEKNEKPKQKKHEQNKKQKQEPAKAKQVVEEEGEVLVRIFGYDIPGSRKVYAGLTRIKGVSWAISNALCSILKIPPAKKIAELSKAEIAKIEETFAKLPVPAFLKNRRYDIETGQTTHVYGADLDMKREFDIKRLKEIRSYKGVRHAHKLPVRGQRTRSHFRKKSVASGMKKKR